MATNPAQLWSRLIGNDSITNATSYATASFTPISGQVMVAAIVSLKATTPDTPTASGTNGLNGTWTQIGTTVTIQTPAGNFIGLSVFTSTATSNTAGVLTFSYGAGTQLAAVWDVITSPFVNTTTPVVQSKTATDTSAATTLSVTLNSALAAAANWVIGYYAENAASTPAATAPVTSYAPSPSASNTSASSGLGMRGVVGSTIASSMQSFTASIAKAAIVFEIAQDGTGAVSGGLLGNEGFSGGFTQ